MTESRFTVERTGPNALRVCVAGALDARMMEVGLQLLSQEMTGMAHGDLLILDQGTEWPSLGAIAVELRHWPQLMAMLHQIDRVALVTHNPWFRTAATIESALIPGYEIRNFNDAASAAEWLESAPEPAT